MDHYNFAVSEALEWVTKVLVDPKAEPPNTPVALVFLLRRYTSLGQTDVQSALEPALGRALDRFDAESNPSLRCDGLNVYAEPVSIPDDIPIGETVQVPLPSPIEALEQFVRQRYEPGEGLIGTVLADQIGCASALLAAFELTGRLPYPMLADELLHAARRTDWDAQAGIFRAEF